MIHASGPQGEPTDAAFDIRTGARVAAEVEEGWRVADGRIRFADGTTVPIEGAGEAHASSAETVLRLCLDGAEVVEAKRCDP